MKFFQKVNMASESIDSYMRSGRVFKLENAVEAHGGDLVVPEGIMKSEVYGDADENVFKFVAPKTGATNLFILDPVKVPEATNGDLVYRMGVKTLGIKVNPGEIVAARQLALNDQFLVGFENLGIASKPEVGDFFTLKNDAFEHETLESLESAQGYAVVVDAVRTISQGVGTNGLVDAVLLRVVRL